MIKTHSNLGTTLSMSEETSQLTVALNTASKHTLEHIRSISLVFTANSQGWIVEFHTVRFELKKAGGAVCVN
jgi:hypothetical protein